MSQRLRKREMMAVQKEKLGRIRIGKLSDTSNGSWGKLLEATLQGFGGHSA